VISGDSVESLPTSNTSDNEDGIFSLEEQAELDSLIESLGSNISVYYEDIKTGDSYGYKSNTGYYVASVVKAPFAMYVYQLADKGETDISAKYEYESKYHRTGSGVINDSLYGTKFKLSEILEYTIRQSDNTAFCMIRNNFSTSDFLIYLKTIGYDGSGLQSLNLSKNTINGSLSAKNAGLLAKRIYEYGESGSVNGKKLIEDMMNTDVHELVASKYPVARKYGSWTGALHDMAIVYAPKPYVLCIFTGLGKSDDGDYTKSTYEVFSKISEKIEALSQD